MRHEISDLRQEKKELHKHLDSLDTKYIKQSTELKALRNEFTDLEQKNYRLKNELRLARDTNKSLEAQVGAWKLQANRDARCDLKAECEKLKLVNMRLHEQLDRKHRAQSQDYRNMQVSKTQSAKEQ